MGEVNADLDLSARFATTLYVADTLSYVGQPSKFVTFEGNAQVVALFGAFESVALRRAVVSFRGPCLDSGYARAAFVPSVATNVDSLDTAVISDIVYFSPQQPLSFDLVLPAGHPFGVELKNVTLGNPRPKLCLNLVNLPESAKEQRTLHVRYVLELECSGRSPTRALMR